MLIVLNNKDDKLHRPMNLTGVANPNITGDTIIDTTKDLHTHDDTAWIDHTVTTPPARTHLNTLVVHADTNRLG